MEIVGAFSLPREADGTLGVHALMVKPRVPFLFSGIAQAARD
jgi:hypothetical protein